MSMIERVARAIYRQRSERVYPTRPDEVDRAAEEGWHMCRDDARAAIAAMREPTEPMFIGARDWSRAFVGTPIGNAAATGCYQSMIDAALGVSDGA